MAQKKKNAAASRRTSSGNSSGSGRKSTARSASGTSGGKKTTGRSGTGKSTRRKSTKKSSQRETALNSARKKNEQQQREIRGDIALVVLLLIMLVLYLSLLGLCGSVGEILGRILWGFFGRSAWGVPAWLFALCLYLMNGTGGRRMPVRLCGFALLLLAAGAVFHLHLHAAHMFTLETAFDLQKNFSKCAELSDGGGIFCGFFAWMVYHAFGFTGSILVYVGLAVIGLILLLQRSPGGLYRWWLERREESDRPGLSERRALRRQQRLEEMEAREEARLEREADRILRTDTEREMRRERRRKQPLDLEHTRLDNPETESRTGTAGSRDVQRTGRQTGRATGDGRADRRRDVHEIVLTTDPGERIQTEVPVGRRSQRGEAGLRHVPGYMGRYPDPDPEQADKGGEKRSRSDAELFTIHGRSRPEEEGTTWRKPDSFPEKPEGDPGNLEKPGPDPDGSRMEAEGRDGTMAASSLPASDPAGHSTGTAGGGSVRTAGGADAAASAPVPTEEELSGITVHRDSGKGKTAGSGAGRTAAARRGGRYVHPPYKLLDQGGGGRTAETERELQETAYQLQETLRTFGVQVTITDISQGPSVTRYELMPDQGVKVSRIVNLSDDIKLRLAATDIRIEAPIPGKSAIGIEVPNKHETTVHLRDLLETRAFRRSDRPIPFAVGRDIGGQPVIADITRMPHLLIAGATGSGKSVCINTIILSILYRTSPEDVRLLMIDPKVVELSVYKKIPHLIIPVVTDPRKASAALNWAVAEMEKRYKLFAAAGVRDLNGYNELARKYVNDEGEPERAPMPRLVIIVDELADLMMTAKSEVESAIVRLTQLARAAGIHLIIATQRPSVDVITGLIKANMPSRIAFAVSSQVDSRTILDMAGAEKLIGRGDMLYKPQDYQKPARIQGAFVSDDEVNRVVKFIKENNSTGAHDEEIERQIDDIEVNGLPAQSGPAADVKTDPARDEHFVEAGRFIIEKNKASIGLLQRIFKIGFNRAARIMDQLAEAGVVSEESSTRARQVLMTMPEFEAWLEENS